MKTIVVLLLVNAVVTGPVLAAESPLTPATVKAAGEADKADKAKPAKEKKVCTEEQLVGSKIPRFVCRTASQAAEERFHGQQSREQMRNEGAVAGDSLLGH